MTCVIQQCCLSAKLPDTLCDCDSGWEDAMLKLLKGIRAKETSYAIRMARIRAMNMALYFFITPLVSFIVFTVVS